MAGQRGVEDASTRTLAYLPPWPTPGFYDARQKNLHIRVNKSVRIAIINLNFEYVATLTSLEEIDASESACLGFPPRPLTARRNQQQAPVSGRLGLLLFVRLDAFTCRGNLSLSLTFLLARKSSAKKLSVFPLAIALDDVAVASNGETGCGE